MNISKEKFEFAGNVELHDKKLDTKPIGYFKDAMHRFKKNKGSVFAAFIILFLVLFAIIGPFLTPYTVSYQDMNFAYCAPKTKMSETFGWDFWDGCEDKTISETDFLRYRAISEELGQGPIKNYEKGAYSAKSSVNGKIVYKIRYDTYRRKGVELMDLSMDQYLTIQQYQNETGVQVIYPMINRKLSTASGKDNTLSDADQGDFNFWYKTEVVKGKTQPVLENGQFIPIYKALTMKDGERTDLYNSTKVDFDENGNSYSYATINKNTNRVHARVDVYEYYVYNHSYVLKDGVSDPLFIFGSTQMGQDIFVRLASGARFSFIFAIIVATVNMIVGAIYGAIEGYYGGAADLLMERFSDILGSIPFMIVITLLKLHMKGSSQMMILFISFFLTGWMGMAGTVRMQFYRFKNQEYILAARTLGARDRRIMFKHIFPNALGTIVTRSVLVIPGMIFSESSLSYLGIINLSSGNMTSVGAMLASAQTQMQQYPYMMFYPAMFISLLMLAFNLFGNGLRDAFNPSLRGTED